MFRKAIAGIDFTSVTFQLKLQEPCIAQSPLVPCKILSSVLAYTVKLAAKNAVEKISHQSKKRETKTLSCPSEIDFTATVFHNWSCKACTIRHHKADTQAKETMNDQTFCLASGFLLLCRFLAVVLKSLLGSLTNVGASLRCLGSRQRACCPWSRLP